MLHRIVNRLRREARFWLNLRRANRIGVAFSPPNYIYKNRLGANSTIVDVGCADNPDFSLLMIEKFGVKAFAVDPTRKHFASLAYVHSIHPDNFVHLPLALASECSSLIFHESKTNASGSLLDSHVNVTNDETESYEVEAVSIQELLSRIGVSSIGFVKLDLEGMEYRLLEKATAENFSGIDQLFVEFHHHCIPEYGLADTKRMVKKILGFGFEHFSIDGHNFLFWRKSQ